MTATPKDQEPIQVEILSEKDAQRVYEAIRATPGQCLVETRVFPYAANGELLPPVLTINRKF